MSASDERAERLAAALRANLRRRKAGRSAAASDDGEQGSAGGDKPRPDAGAD